MDSPFEGRIDLVLAGHTHDGQVNPPFYGTPVLPVRNKDYSFGLKTSPKGHRVFISRGIGWAVYAVRFNCFPEIPILNSYQIDQVACRQQRQAISRLLPSWEKW